jgi:hypothetical protein
MCYIVFYTIYPLLLVDDDFFTFTPVVVVDVLAVVAFEVAESVCREAKSSRFRASRLSMSLLYKAGRTRRESIRMTAR